MIAVRVSDRKGELAAFSTKEGERLLHVGLSSGVGLPHECATGTCGNCKATIVSGDVLHLWPEAPGAKVCRKTGEVLLCQTAAVSALELVLPSAFIPQTEPSCGKVRGHLAGRQMLTPDVALFEVALESPLDYRPGQFVLLSGFGIQGPRAYSMTHHAPDEARLRFLVRRSESGLFTKRLFECSPDNESIEVFGPLGRATFDCGEERPFVAVAGGSGIAGMMAIIRDALACQHFVKHPSRLFFGLRDCESGYLLDDLHGFAEEADGDLQIVVAFSDGSCPAEFAAKFPALDFRHGFVHEVMRDVLCADDKSEMKKMQRPLFFVGGPPLMVNATMRTLITECKASPTEIRYDRFG
jgi:toluene monooxygenase electron transfer component